MIFDHSAQVIAVDQKEHQQIYPQPGWVEHNPLEIWERTQEVIRGAVARANAQPGDIAAVGVTNQRETTLVWDRNTGRPYYNAIVWQDRRTASLCDELKQEGLEPLWQEKTGLLMDPYFARVTSAYQQDLRKVVALAAEHGIAVPAFMSALAYYDGYRSERLPANLLQAQRDYFGAHTYERVDRPRGEFFHTDWTGRGGDVTARTYQA